MFGIVQYPNDLLTFSSVKYNLEIWKVVNTEVMQKSPGLLFSAYPGIKFTDQPRLIKQADARAARTHIVVADILPAHGQNLDRDTGDKPDTRLDR